MRVKLTFWEAVDEFLKDLAKGDVCKNPSYPDNEYYRSLMSTVCEGGEDALGLIRIKPYYPFILIAYYILFHRHNLDLAGKIYNKLREFYDKYPYTFTSGEKCAFEMLGEVVNGLTNGQSPAVIARMLDGYGGVNCEWGLLFKLLLQSHLDPVNHERYRVEFHRVEGQLPSLNDIYREIEELEREDDARYQDEDVNYYILLPLKEEESPIHVFIRNMFGKYRSHSN